MNIRDRIRPRCLALLLGIAVAASLSSCGFGGTPLAVVDPLAAPLRPTYEQVKAILDRKCLACHRGGGGGDSAPADTAQGTPGEREHADYSTCQGIQAGLQGILRTGVAEGSMPPGALPRFTEREKLIVTRWIEQGACSPCRPCP